jgi:hypothetical protein
MAVNWAAVWPTRNPSYGDDNQQSDHQHAEDDYAVGSPTYRNVLFLLQEASVTRLGGHQPTPALEKVTELSFSPRGEGSVKSCVSANEFSGKVTGLVRLVALSWRHWLEAAIP